MRERYDVVEMPTAEPTLRRFTVDEYERMGQVGILAENERVELIDGLIVEMAAIGSKHAGTVNRLNRLLVTTLGDRGVVSVQNPVRLPPWSEPEPDLLVARPRDDDYTASHPEAPDTLLCVEVADTTVAVDRRKLSVYARDGVGETWIVNIPDERVEVHRDPVGERYTSREVHERGGRISPSAFPDLVFAVDDILPPGRV